MAQVPNINEDKSWADLLEAYPRVLSDGRCLLSWRGSVAHGTYEESGEWATDDVDLINVRIPDPVELLSGREWGSRGTVETQVGKWDVVTYDYRKVLRLLEKGNPNVLSLLWLPQEKHLFKDTAGSVLIGSRETFSTKAAYPAFRGYAQAQLQKMQGHGKYQGYMGERRKELVDRYGYDTKQASHLIRLLRMGVEFLTTGEMVVDREVAGDREELLAIKHGEWSKEAVERVATELDTLLERSMDKCRLPEEADRRKVDYIAYGMARAHWRERGRWVPIS